MKKAGLRTLSMSMEDII
ncbi:gp52.1 [Bacillus phage SPO1]|uniref:Gp52.1 n=1 Tax=Bacillus phage SP01 TaxID=2884427 RepID=B6V2V9_BPSP1|nr:gp52.1 [Bacillus phage SPO1]ACI90927.1 gp52.1 [Bacillus phage SPO1]